VRFRRLPRNDPAHPRDRRSGCSRRPAHAVAVSVRSNVGRQRGNWNLTSIPVPAQNESEINEAGLFYVGATRATQRLIIGLSGERQFVARFAA
jgi:hypothetical protein